MCTENQKTIIMESSPPFKNKKEEDEDCGRAVVVGDFLSLCCTLLHSAAHYL
jgi:hypothetical protein